MKGFKIQQGYSLKRKVQTQAKVEAKLKDAAKMYEKQFLREMVKAMRSTVKHSEMSKPGYAEKIYQNQLDNQYAENWGETGGIGLSKLIFEQIKSRHFKDKNLQKPSGPIPINQQKFLKNDLKPGKLIPVKQNDTDKDLSFIFDTKNLENKQATSPWSGTIKNIFNQENQKVIEIEHDINLSSIISFDGEVHKGLKPGARVEQGMPVGDMSNLNKPLYWKLFS